MWQLMLSLFDLQAHATIFLEIVKVMTELGCNLLTISNVLVLPFLFDSKNFASCKLRSIVMPTAADISLVLFFNERNFFTA